MKTKFIRNIFAGSLVASLCAGLTACDDIDEKDRFIPVERPTVERVVLAMDFTGMRCINCPTAATALHQSAEKYPGSVVIVGIHAAAASDFTLPLMGLDLRAPVSDVYYNYFKPAALPSASINGGKVLSGTELSIWTTTIDEEISKPSPADVVLSTTYDEAKREVTVDYTVTFNEMHSEETSILLWLTESNIVGPQMSATSLIPAYEHNHVLRASLNGDWGEVLGKNFATEQTLSGTATLTLDEKWKAENCEIVGFIFNTSDRAVQQAADVRVIESAAE